MSNRRTKRWTRSRGSGGFEMVTLLAAARSTHPFPDKHDMWAKPPRTGGLRIRGHRGHPDVHAAIMRFAKWLRTIESYPVRIPVYLSPYRFLTTTDDRTVSALFLAPYDPAVEPYIRIATGDYPELLAEHGRDVKCN